MVLATLFPRAGVTVLLMKFETEESQRRMRDDDCLLYSL